MSNLLPGENLVLKAHPHWITFIRSLIVPIVLVLLVLWADFTILQSNYKAWNLPLHFRTFLTLAVVAIWLITRPEPSDKKDSSGRPAGVGMAALAGVGFAGFYLCIHQASGSPTWIAVIARIGSFTATAIAVIATRAPLVLDRPRVALGMIAGFFDITASALFIFASQRGRLDEAVVLTSLYPAITVLLARLVLREHFSRWKFVGLLAALAAVPMIAAG